MFHRWHPPQPLSRHAKSDLFDRSGLRGALRSGGRLTSKSRSRLGWGFDLWLVHPTLLRCQTQRIWKWTGEFDNRCARRKFGEAYAARVHLLSKQLLATIYRRCGPASEKWFNKAILNWELVPADENSTDRLTLPSNATFAFPTHNKPVSSHLTQFRLQSILPKHQ
jgi:hypothetical protein